MKWIVGFFALVGLLFLATQYLPSVYTTGFNLPVANVFVRWIYIGVAGLTFGVYKLKSK